MVSEHTNIGVPPARIAGLFYLITAIAGSLTFFIGPSIVSGDPAATATNIAADEQMWRLNFVMLLIAGAAYFGVAAMLYEIFKPVSPTFSTVVAFFGLACCAMTILHAHQLAPLFYLGNAEYLAAFNAEQLQVLAYMPLRLQSVGEDMGFMYSGFYTFSLGCLVVGSKFMPRLLGVLLIVTGLSWLTQSFASFLAISLPGPLSNSLMAASILGEVAFLLWLLVMGVNVERWREQAGATYGKSASG